MKKNIIIAISATIVILVMSLFLVLMKTDNPQSLYTESEIKFKEEYELLNGTEYGENTLKTLNINNDNNVVYLNEDEIIDALKIGTKVIYLGWAECNWCRTMLPILLDVLKTNEIEELYYYNFKELRSAYESNSNKDKVKIYEDIIDIVGEDITTTFDEKSERNGEKKILAPTVIFIKDGKYIGLHFKTVDSQIKSSDELNDEQIKELKQIYQNYIDIMNMDICTEDSEGC